jgi:WD40 repeat protein
MAEPLCYALHCFCRLLLIAILAADIAARACAQQPGNATAKVDAFGDPLPAGVLMRIGSGRMRHNDRVREMVVSADGKLLATGGGYKIRIWDTATGGLYRQFDLGSSWGHWMAFSADGAVLTSVDGYHDLTCRRFDLRTGKELSKFHLDFDADGELSGDGSLMVVAGEDQTAHLYETATGKQTGAFKIELGGVIIVRPDGKAIAVTHAKTKTARVYEIPSGKALAQFQAELIPFSSPVFSPDGRFLAGNDGKLNGIRIRDSATGEERLRLGGSRYYHTELCFSPDGKLLVAGGPEAPDFSLWDLSTGKLIRRTTCRWPPGYVQISLDNKTVFTTSRDGAILAWDVASGKLLPLSAHPATAVRELRFVDGGKRLIGQADRFRAWDPATGREVKEFPTATGLSALSPDATLLADSTPEGAIRLLDAVSGKELRTWKGHDRTLWALAFSADGKRLFSTGGREPVIRAWDVATGQREAEIAGAYRDGIMQLAVSPDGQLVTSSGNFTVETSDLRLWDIGTGRELHRFAVHLQMKHHPVFSPDGRWLAAATARPGVARTWGEVQVWEVVTGKRLGIFTGHKNEVTALAFSPDSRTLAAGSADRTVLLWDLASRQERQRLVGHVGTIQSLAFAPDNRRLAASSPEAPVYIWDVASGTRRDPPPGTLAEADLDGLWNALGSDDAAKAYRAVLTLTATPGQAMPMLQKRLHAATPPDADRLQQLVADLDSDQFAVRKKASAELTKLGESAVPALRDVLSRDPSPEVARRLNTLLEKATNREPSGELLRALRAIAVLEQIATLEARQLLEKLATGVPEARFTREAKAAQVRLQSPTR